MIVSLNFLDEAVRTFIEERKEADGMIKRRVHTAIAEGACLLTQQKAHLTLQIFPKLSLSTLNILPLFPYARTPRAMA